MRKKKHSQAKFENPHCDVTKVWMRKKVGMA